MYTFDLVPNRRSSADLHIRLPPNELRSWKKAARRDNETLTDWLRAWANFGASERQAKQRP